MWKWNIEDLPTNRKGKVLSCFSCGGGSSFGYKLAGFDVIGNCEIDKAINAMYVKNQHPKYNFLSDIREFNKRTDLPEELYQLDILDGSPPCSTFSVAGKREEGWGVEKVFREGQAKQRLDDLFFDFLDTANKLKPKVVVAENVEGLIKGNAKGYVTEIIQKFHSIGYDVQLFRLDSSLMGVPQKRTRVFFIANRLNFKKLNLNFSEKPISFGAVKSEKGKEIKSEDVKFLLRNASRKDKCLADINQRTRGKTSRFTSVLVRDSEVCPTVTSGGEFFRLDGDKWSYFSDSDFVSVQTFPQNYNFCGQSVQYVCGMSVPPVMMKHIAEQIRKQWLIE